MTSSPISGLVDWDAYVPREETQAIATAAREHFSSLFSLDDLRGMLDGRPKPDLWDRLVEHGYTAVGIPESLEGLGTLVDLTALLQEAGRALLPAPLLTHAMAAQTLEAAGMLDESTVASSLAFAFRRGDALLVFDGAAADFAVTVESRDDGCAMTLFPLGDAPREAVAGPDPSRAFVRIALADLGAETQGRTLGAPADALLAGARTCVAADLTGVAARALDAGIAHSLTREQFGRPIGSFQAVKHQLADAYVEVELTRSLVLGAAVALTGEPHSDEGLRLSLMAKASAGEAAARCTALLTQLLGAIGLTYESDSPLGVRRARQTIPLLGHPGELYARVALLSTGGEA